MAILDDLVSNKRKLFLIDGMGALVSALVIGGVMTRLPEWFGLPHFILHSLALVAFALAFYGFMNALGLFGQHRVLLWATFMGNCFYIVFTGLLLVMFARSLKPLDFAYFIGEMAIVAVLAAVEYRALRVTAESRP